MLPGSRGLGDFPGGTNGKEPACHCRSKRRGFNPWVGKIPWRRAQQPTLVFFPGEFHGQESGGPVHKVIRSKRVRHD